MKPIRRALGTLLLDRGALWLGPLLLAWVVYALLWPQAPVMRSDSQGYLEVATDLQDAHLDQLHDRTWGYPLLLVAAGAVTGPTRALFHAQLALYLLAVGFVGVFLRRGAVPRWGRVAFLLVALAPPSIATTAYVLTEACSAALLTTGMVSLLFWLGSGRRGWLALGSVLLGAVGVVRPAFLLVCAPVVIALLLARRLDRGRRGRYNVATLAVLATALLFDGGLLAFNAARFGFPGATPLLGFNLSTRTARVVERLPDTYASVRELLVAARDHDLVAGDEAHTGVMYIWSARDELRHATGLDGPSLSRYMLRLNLVLLRAAPLSYLQDVAHSTADFWFPWVPDLASFGSRSLQLCWSLAQLVVVGIFLLQLVTLAGVAAVAIVLPAARRTLVSTGRALHPLAWTGTLLAIFVILYSMVVSATIDIGNPRYRAPTDLLLWLATIVLLDGWRRARRSAPAAGQDLPAGAASSSVAWQQDPGAPTRSH